MLRRTSAAVLLGAVLAGCSWFSESTPPPTVGNATIEVQPVRPTFTVGEPVELAVTITNTWTQPCRLTTSALGALTVLELTHDGAPQAPQLTEASFLNGFENAVAATLVEVPPGESVRFDFAGPDGTLDSYSGDARGGAEVSRWPVGQPGRYEVTVGYLRPPLADVPADPCQASGTTAAASFIVEQA